MLSKLVQLSKEYPARRSRGGSPQPPKPMAIWRSKTPAAGHFGLNNKKNVSRHLDTFRTLFESFGKNTITTTWKQVDELNKL